MNRDCRGRKLTAIACRKNPRTHFIGFVAVGQSILNAAETIVVWNGVTSEENIKAQSDGTFIVITKGLYAVQGEIHWAANGAGDRQCFMRINGNSGAGDPRYGRCLMPAAPVATGTGQVFSAQIVLEIGDFFEIMVEQTTGVALVLHGEDASISVRSEISIALIAAL